MDTKIPLFEFDDIQEAVDKPNHEKLNVQFSEVAAFAFLEKPKEKY